MGTGNSGVLLFTCLLLVIPARGQEPTEAGARFTLRGSVVNSVTGEPVRKALVEIGGPQSKRAFTGPDGQFQMEGLAGGNFTIAARRPGFMEAAGWPLSPSVAGSGPITVTAAGGVTVGPDMGAVVIKLVPQAKISGRVLDTEGEPVANLRVQCLQQNIQAGHKIWQQAQTVNTDEEGNFLIEHLSRGMVLVQTLQQQVYPGMIDDDNASRLVYRRQYYPNSPDIGAAQAIELSPGQEARVELSVSTIRGTRVFFAVTPPQQGISAALWDANGDSLEVEMQQNVRTGGWILPSVPPGLWTLRVSSYGQQQLSGEVAIQVGSDDVRNVAVPLSPVMQAPIVVSGGTSSAPGVPPVNVQLLPAISRIASNPYLAAFSQVGQGGRLTMQGVAPGAYHVVANAIGSECVESITSGSSDLSRADYVISGESSPPAIHVGLRSDCASLEVFMGQRGSQTGAVIVAGGPNASEPQLAGYMSPGGSPTFRLSPGDYEVYAFSDLTDVEYANPDVLRKYSGQHVSLSSNQKARVNLDMNAPAEKQ